MQRENERSRVVLEGRLVADGQQCSCVVIGECSGGWAMYPHGAEKLGVRLSNVEAVKLARAILAAHDAEPAEHPGQTCGTCGTCGRLP